MSCACNGNNHDGKNKFFNGCSPLQCHVEPACFGLTDPDEFPTLVSGSDPYRNAWKQITIEESFELPCGFPNIQQVNSVNLEIKILKTKVFRTPPATGNTLSNENQNLTGYKLAVEGLLCQKITYCTDCGQTYCIDNVRPFSTFIVLPVPGEGTPNHFDVADCLKVTPYIENCFVQCIGPRTIFKNVFVLLKVCR